MDETRPWVDSRHNPGPALDSSKKEHHETNNGRRWQVANTTRLRGADRQHRVSDN